MPVDRRLALALGGSILVAACRRRPLRVATGKPVSARSMNAAVLDQGFPALASRALPGAFAMGVMNLQTSETWFWNTERAFPLAASAALPIAAAALAQVDAGQLSLTERAPISSLDLSPLPSLIDQNWPSPPDDHRTSLPIEDLISLALKEGDNTAIDVLMHRIGGPGAVTAWLQLKGVTGLRVDRYRRELGVDLFGMEPFRPAWKDPGAFEAARDELPPGRRQAAMDAYIVDPRNSSTVPAALGFLAMLSAGELLSRRSADRLRALLYQAPGGCLRSGLRPGVAFARALGSTPTDLGFTAAVAEMGIATWPDGRSYVLAGFLVGSTGTADARNALFADAARLAERAIG